MWALKTVFFKASRPHLVSALKSGQKKAKKEKQVKMKGAGVRRVGWRKEKMNSAE